MYKYNLSFLLIVFNMFFYFDGYAQAENAQLEDSTFNQLMNAMNGGKIPFPFKDLINSIGDNAIEESNILMIPKGRSLVKHHSNLRNPRLLVDPLDLPKGVGDSKEELRKKLGIAKGDLYLGYVPGTDKIEVISFNKSTNKYDFFIIDDYASGKKPKLSHQTGMCTTCHQNGGPIFPKSPWTEILGKTSHKITNVGGFVKVIGENEMMERIIKANPDRSDIEGVPINRGLKRFDAFRLVEFDSGVRNNSDRLMNNQICSILCQPNDLECKKNIFKMAYSQLIKPITNDKNLALMTSKKNIDAYKINVKKIVIKSDSIPDRNSDTSVLSLADDPTSKREESENFIKIRDVIMGIKTPKEAEANIVQMCFNQIEFKKLVTEQSLSSFTANLDRESAKLDLLLFPNRRNGLQKILTGKDYFDPKPCKVMDSLEVSLGTTNIPAVEKIVQKINDDLVSTPTQYFQKYCMECHDDKSLLSLPLNSLKELGEYEPTMSSGSVSTRLEKKRMPPDDAKIPLPDSIRRKMIDAVKIFEKR